MGVGVDLFVRQVTGERPTKGGVDRSGLKDGLGVIYLSACEGVGPRRATTRDAGELPSAPLRLIEHAGSSRQDLAKQFTNAPSQKGTQHEASLPPRLDDQPDC